jgi:hypothetical protein
MTQSGIFWAGIAPGPAIWFLQLLASFALAPLACPLRWKPMFYISITSVLVISASFYICWRNWRQPDDTPLSQARSRMALGGMILNAFSILVILAQAVPNLMMSGCE